MALVGDHIFAGQGPRLVVLDVSNPTGPHKVSESDVLPGLVDNVIVRNGTAYITAGRIFMQLDVSDPTHIVHEGQTELPSAGRILLRDNVIYAGGQTAQFRDPDGTTYESYIATVDVSGEPKLVDEIVIPYDVLTLALAGDQLFIGHDQGISRLDVTDPSRLPNPVPGPRVNEADILRVYGSTLLVGGYSETIAYDVADPQAPEHMWTEERAELGVVRDFAVLNDRIYTVGWQPAAAFTPTSVAVQMADPLPEPDYYSAAGSVGIIAVAGRLYRMDQRTLSIEDISSGEPAPIGSYTALSGGDMAIDENVLFVANRTRNLLSGPDQDYVDTYRVPDLSLLDQFALPPVGEQGTEGLSSITLYDDRLYLFGSLEMRAVSSDSFTQLGAVQSSTQDELILLGQHSWRKISIPVVNTVAYLYGSTGEQEFIVRFDVSDPANIVELDRIPLRPGLRIVDIDVTENWLVVSLENNTDQDRDALALYDLTTGETPSIVAEIEVTTAPTEIKTGDNILLAGSGDLANQYGILESYSLPALALLGQAQIPHIHEISLREDYALITMSQDSSLLAVDLDDPANLQVAGVFDLPDDEGEIAVSGPFLIVGNEEMGMYVLEHEP